MQVRQVRPTLWDAVEEARARRAGLRPLRLSLLGDTLTDSGLSQLGRALRELQVVKAWSQCPKSQMPKGARSEAVGLPEPQVTDSPASQSPCLEGEPQGTMASLRHELHQKNPLRHPKEQVIPNVPQEQPEAVGGVKSYRAQLTCPCLPGPNVREKYETFDK
ncbi:uncharacterized protein LOC104652350 isoform X2 [Saimiri boliviensis]|uniref:uncharacterized protein LOC104652350 isoform X2 n=1 Tax=Saimiri boliviensis TaxID=27679 RepID=UPI003D77A7C5